MNFGKPSFGNRKPGGKFGKGDFDAGLDDLEEDGSGKKDTRRNEGQREFISLGSTAKGGESREEFQQREERK